MRADRKQLSSALLGASRLLIPYKPQSSGVENALSMLRICVECSSACNNWVCIQQQDPADAEQSPMLLLHAGPRVFNVPASKEVAAHGLQVRRTRICSSLPHSPTERPRLRTRICAQSLSGLCTVTLHTLPILTHIPLCTLDGSPLTTTVTTAATAAAGAAVFCVFGCRSCARP